MDAMRTSALREIWKRAPQSVRRVIRAPVLNFLIALGAQRARGRALGPAASEPVAVMGLHSAVLGVGEAARLWAQALSDAGILTTNVDVTTQLGHAAVIPVPNTREAGGAATLLSQINPPELLLLTALQGLGSFGAGRHIGLWTWETERIPRAWVSAFNLVDEVWAPSTFVADAIRRAAPSRVNVSVAPYPTHVARMGRSNRARFGLPGEGVVVLAAADARSSFARKNPLGALQAFTRGGAGATLVLKLVGTEAAPREMKMLREHAAAAPNIFILDQTFDKQDMADLVASADIVMSLHRAEGYGLMLAEAMQMGKSVIATRYSGNLDFMDETNAALVDFKRVRIADPQGIYTDGHWADPAIDHASELLKRLIACPDYRDRLGSAAMHSTRGRAEQWRAHTRALLAFKDGALQEAAAPALLPSAHRQ